MSYKKADKVLPAELLALVQQYVDGECLYIPRKDERRAWGASTQIRSELQSRNAHIYEGYLSGMTTSELAELYCLSIKSVQRIVLQKKRAA